MRSRYLFPLKSNTGADMRDPQGETHRAVWGHHKYDWTIEGLKKICLSKQVCKTTIKSAQGATADPLLKVNTSTIRKKLTTLTFKGWGGVRTRLTCTRESGDKEQCSVDRRVLFGPQNREHPLWSLLEFLLELCWFCVINLSHLLYVWNNLTLKASKRRRISVAWRIRAQLWPISSETYRVPGFTQSCNTHKQQPVKIEGGL